MSKVKKLIIIVIALMLIIGIIIGVVLINGAVKQQVETTDNGYEEPESLAQDQPEENFVPVSEAKRNKYFVVEKVINNYITDMKQANGIIGEEQYDDEDIRQEGLEKMFDLLDSRYKESMSVTKANIANRVKNYTDYYLNIDKMYISERSDYSINLFLVYATIDNEEFNVMVALDSKNETFSIFLQDYIQEYNYVETMKKEDIKIDNSKIEENDYNTFKFVNIRDEYIAVQYLTKYVKMMVNNPEKAYEKLDEEYRNQRFENVDSFKKYVEANKDEILEIATTQYSVNTLENGKQYICKDKYGRIFEFSGDEAMNYTVILDTYTLNDDDFNSEYDKADNNIKVAMNIRKWIDMINYRDYESAYEYLDETFRNDNFGTVEEFEAYMKNYFPLHYVVSFGSFQKTEGLYVQEITLEDASGDTDVIRDESVIMQLNDNRNFVMSFKLLRH